MAKGNHNHRGRGGSRGGPDRGRPGGRARGRGRSGGSGGGRGRGGFGYMDDFDFPIQEWPDNEPPSRGTYFPRPRGRGRPHDTGTRLAASMGIHTQRGTETPRGRGRGRGRDSFDNPSPYNNDRGRGRGGRAGRGNFNAKTRTGVPLSKLLYEDRPLLKPIVFVRSVHTATLFQEEEEILKPLAEPVADDKQSHVPTADQVSRVFNEPEELPDRTRDADESSEEEQLEEVDFADVGKIQAEVDATAASLISQEQPVGATTEVAASEEKFTGFYVDTNPTPVGTQSTKEAVKIDRMDGVLGEQSQDDDIIVYVAPHPRTGRITSALSTPTIAAVESVTTTSIITGIELSENQSHEDSIVEPPAATEIPVPESPLILPPPPFNSVSFSFAETPRKKQARKIFPVGGPRSLLKRSKKARRRSLRNFGSYGAMMAEAGAQQEGREKDPRESEQRRGDSDVNWGDSSSEGGDAMDQLSNGVGAMDLDGDVDISAMKSFVNSMSAEGSRHVTMDDIADIQRMKAEDAEEDEEDRGSSARSDQESEDEDEEIERVVDAEERQLVGEEEERDGTEGDEDEEDEDSSDNEETPRTSFQARLAKLRASAKNKHEVDEGDASSDEAMSIQMTWQDEDDEFFAEIEEILDQNAGILNGRDRKARSNLFRAVANGDFDSDEFESMMKPIARKKDKHVPPELQAQWDKDRSKKAENKRKRAEARLAAAADPLAIHRGGKKGQKAMLAAARLGESLELANQITDLVSLEQQIRRFIADIGGKTTMSLPPASKEMRKKIHELAQAFNLKSQSKGSGKGRYTTLIKTSQSGIGIKEKKINAIMKRYTHSWDAPDRGNSKKISLAKHREGEEVGKAAPKIGESNVGFKMLAAMGWAEGDRIGLSGGLDAPLTAVMKKTKLGLGATL